MGSDRSSVRIQYYLEFVLRQVIRANSVLPPCEMRTRTAKITIRSICYKS